MGGRVENGMGKSRPDLHHLLSKPTAVFVGKIGKREKKGKTDGNVNEFGWDVFPTVFAVPVFIRDIPAGSLWIYVPQSPIHVTNKRTEE